MNKKTDKGIILARTDFGERDRILTVLMRENGKIRLIAKGVRSAKSKLAGGIELFSESNLGYVVGKGEIFTLTSSRLIKYYGNIVQDLAKTETAYEILRTINRVVDDGHGQDYYQLLLASLSYLDKELLSHETMSIWFNLSLLEFMGESINLKTDNKNKALGESPKYSFDYDKNCFYADKSGIYGKPGVKLLRVVSESGKPVNTDIPDKQKESISELLSQIVKNSIS